MAPRSQQWSLRSRSGHTTSHHEICGLWVVDYALLRHLQGWDNRMIADHLAAWLPDVFRPWLSTRTLRSWLDENKKEGREPRDACAAIIPTLREKCDRVGEAGVSVSASVMQPIFNRVAEQHGMTRRFGIKWIRHFLRCAGLKYRVALGGTKKTTDPKLLRFMYYVTEYGVHHEHGRDSREALGLGAA